jgi:hypothetical protein
MIKCGGSQLFLFMERELEDNTFNKCSYDN